MAVPSRAAAHVVRLHLRVQSSGPVIQTAVFVILGSLECVAGPGITASYDSFGHIRTDPINVTIRLSNRELLPIVLAMWRMTWLAIS